MPPLSDHELAQRCLNGDEEAWRLLVERHASLVYAICRALSRNEDEADDLFLESFARLLEKLP